MFFYYEQAACCILAIDSIKINNNIVRAFFGTTKYCNHFLNNYHCFNEEKCMFMHYLAEPSDIIDENTKFGYNDHIKLAKKIIGYGTLQGKYYISKNISQKKAILPNINTIYEKAKDKVNKEYLISASRDKTIKLWDAIGGVCIFTFTGHDNWVRSLCEHPNGKYIVSCSDDKSVRLWDLKTGLCQKKLLNAHEKFVVAISMSPKCKMLASGSNDLTIKIWDCS